MGLSREGDGMNALEISNLTVTYKKFPVVHHLSVAFPKGESSAIIGPNGAGKSTLLKAVMGLVPFSEGEIVKSAGCKVSYLSQISEIRRDLPLTLFELVSAGALDQMGLLGCLSKEAYARVEAALAFVGLEHFGDRSIDSLSGGQFQKALFARIVVEEADLILLDEPFNAMDARTTQELCGLIAKWEALGKTVITVLHDLTLAKQYFSNTLILAREKIAFGRSSEVINDQNLLKAESVSLGWESDAWCEVP